MKRRLFNFAAAVSLLLCVATVGLWVRSYFSRGYVLLFRGQTRNIFIGSGNGVLVLRHNAVISPSQATLRHDVVAGSDAAPFTLPVQAGQKGQVAFVVVGPTPFNSCWFIRTRFTPSPRMTLMDASGRSVTVLGRMDQIDMSFWLVVVAFAVWPLWWYRRWRVERGLPTTLCRSCGYDLRATPDRCPECGTEPVAKQ